MNRTSPTYFARRHVAALALLLAPFALTERAEAACAPPSPLSGSGQTVTCTGTTTNQNGTNGYGTNTDTGNTINVQSGALVSGTGFGLIFSSGAVNNAGNITGTGTGIFAGTARSAGPGMTGRGIFGG
jgi:hypothetical protein